MSVGEWEEELTRLVALREAGFLAFDDAGHPIGMFDLRLENFAEDALDFALLYVEDLWVEPEHRRRGVARLLLQSVENWAHEQGYNRLASDARIDNEKSGIGKSRPALLNRRLVDFVKKRFDNLHRPLSS